MGLLLAALALNSATFANTQGADLPALNREFRAAWVATVDNIDWPSKKDLSTEQQKAELLTIIKKSADLKLNALVFQIRPSCDALYESKLEPWSEYLTGLQGKAPSPMWDPLQYAVSEAHARGIEMHVWFNPYRANHRVQKGPLASNHIGITNPDVVKKYDGYLWMDPSEPFVQKRSLDVIIDVVKRYDIDGVHIDDYFYPYPDKTKTPFPDAPSYARYKANGGSLGIGDFRRQSVDGFIEKLYKEIKKAKRHVKFGISPFGIYRPGIPEGIKAGVDQYDELYADAQKWLVEGWCDYYSPQLYWPIAQKPQSYRTLLDYWVAQNPKKRHVWPGLYTGRTSPTEGNWKPDEVINQIRLSRAKQTTAGNVHFSFKCLQGDFNGIATGLKQSVYNIDSFVPASPWLGDKKPLRPGVSIVGIDTDKIALELSVEGSEFAFAYALGSTTNTGRTSWGGWSAYREGTLINRNLSQKVAVIALSRTGVASDARVIEL
jgi:uncharacterized lipoprotein YddW (UPF0748 family)